MWSGLKRRTYVTPSHFLEVGNGQGATHGEHAMRWHAGACLERAEAWYQLRQRQAHVNDAVTWCTRTHGCASPRTQAVRQYTALLSEKREALTRQADKLRCGEEKLTEAAATVAEMQVQCTRGRALCES
jgi:hypothetical protein